MKNIFLAAILFGMISDSGCMFDPNAGQPESPRSDRQRNLQTGEEIPAEDLSAERSSSSDIEISSLTTEGVSDTSTSAECGGFYIDFPYRKRVPADFENIEDENAMTRDVAPIGSLNDNFAMTRDAAPIGSLNDNFAFSNDKDISTGLFNNNILLFSHDESTQTEDSILHGVNIENMTSNQLHEYIMDQEREIWQLRWILAKMIDRRE